jgi:hypothetical protein
MLLFKRRAKRVKLRKNEATGHLPKASWEDLPRAFGEISQPANETAGTSAAAGLSAGKQVQKG